MFPVMIMLFTGIVVCAIWDKEPVEEQDTVLPESIDNSINKNIISIILKGFLS